MILARYPDASFFLFFFVFFLFCFGFDSLPLSVFNFSYGFFCLVFEMTLQIVADPI